jgi:hypothetical protein
MNLVFHVGNSLMIYSLSCLFLLDLCLYLFMLHVSDKPGLHTGWIIVAVLVPSFLAVLVIILFIRIRTDRVCILFMKVLPEFQSWVFASCCVCEIKMRGVFRLRNFNIVGFYYLFNCFNCYMFQSSSGRHIFQNLLY